MALPKKSQLLLTRRTTLALRKIGKHIQTSCLSIYYLPSDVEENRFAVVVGGVISRKAVVRNKIRRSIQEALVVFSPNLPKEKRVDMILYPKKGIVDLPKGSIGEEVKKLLQQII